MAEALTGDAETSSSLPRPAVPMPAPGAIDSWPGDERRQPRRTDRHYLALSNLAEALRGAIGRHLGTRTGLDVLDIGCGVKPYLPFFRGVAGSYRGIDAEAGPGADEVGTAESLPYADASFDVVLCTQVLEHLYDPSAAVAEIHRVLRPDGVAFVSTHGVFLFHPDPPGSDRDYWRWTHAGLSRLFTTTADWAQIEVVPNGEAVACLTYLACQFVDEAGQRLRSPRAKRAVLGGLNAAAAAVDKRFPARARVPAPGSLSANYLLTAIKPSG